MEMRISVPSSELEWEKYYDLRYRVLRQPWGQVRGSERNEGDLNGIHICLFQDKIPVAIARLDKSEEGVGQVRFMAVEPSFQGKGLGKLVMEEAELQAKTKNYHKIILHARENAVEFYKKLGYELIAPSHLLFGEIQHFLMEKSL